MQEKVYLLYLCILYNKFTYKISYLKKMYTTKGGIWKYCEKKLLLYTK